MTSPHAVPRSISLVDEHLAACLAAAEAKPVLLEVGAKGPASTLFRRKVEPTWTYVGLDYLPDNNVDVVGDAHRLTNYFAPGSVDMVYSSEVMEHLLSPLRFVFEANRVLKLGGIFMARMPTIWPLHAEPWDYWRITQHGWTSLLNVNTGFEILERCEDGRASVVPHQPEPKSGVMLMSSAPAPMLTMVVARKIESIAQDSSGWSPGLSTGSYEHA
jgi:SAM-dependent methyltransferase